MSLMVLVSPQIETERQMEDPMHYWESFQEWVVDIGSLRLWVHNLHSFSISSAHMPNVVRALAIVSSSQVRCYELVDVSY